MAPLPGMRSSGDTGRTYSRDGLQEEHLHHGGERKRLEEEQVTKVWNRTEAFTGQLTAPLRARLRSTPLRSA